jgi:mRNA interferase MazF
MRAVPTEVALGPEDGLEQPCAVNLHNVLTLQKAAVGRRICQLSESRMPDVCAALQFALGCSGSSAE